MRFHDAHNHLQDERFAGRQADLIRDCREAGVTGMVVNGSTVEDWADVATLARDYPELVRPAFGVHPWYVGEQPSDWEDTLVRRLDETPGASIGEIGLDRWKEGVDFELQRDFFQRQLRLAAVRNLPASIHCLKAWGALYDILRAGPVPACGFLLHSYGGPVELVDPLARLGARFSLPGYFAHERKGRQRETFRHVPPDRLLIETDAPDQSLPSERNLHPLTAADGRPLNHPANLPAVYAFAAELLNEPVESLVNR
ncbi:MAG: TatD family hydrolase, partial [Verrucomicrobiae bacterium]|nr:TatD family hydrolase [Verrucomicrobiae bacterium]